MSILGTFNAFVVGKLPSATKRFSVFLQLADGSKDYQVTVEVHDLREDQVIARSPPMVVRFPARLFNVNVIIPCPPLPILHAGAYDFVVFADGEEIDRQKFHVSARNGDASDEV